VVVVVEVSEDEDSESEVSGEDDAPEREVDI